MLRVPRHSFVITCSQKSNDLDSIIPPKSHTPLSPFFTHGTVDCYVTGVPLNLATRIILVFADLYGMQYGNQKAFCDQLADHLPHTTILLPDLFRGRPILKLCFYRWAMLPPFVKKLFFRVNHITTDLIETV